MFYAVENQNEILVNKFIELDFNLDAQDKDGCPLIFHAIQTGNIKILAMLLQSGANLHVTYRNCNALHFVDSKLKNPKMIDFLLSQGVEPNLDVICSCLLEIPIKSFQAVLGDTCDEVIRIEQGKKILDTDKLRKYLEENILKTSLIIDILKMFISENNTAAVKSLLLILPQELDCSNLLNYYIETSKYDNQEMFKILFELNSNIIDQSLFEGLLYACCQYEKWECLKSVRLLANLAEINFEEIVHSFLETFEKFEYLSRKAELESQREQFNRELRTGLNQRRNARNHGLASQFDAEAEADLVSSIEKQSSNLRALEEKYQNLKDACCSITVLTELDALKNDPMTVGISSIIEAIDSNNSALLMNYVSDDQSDGREGHIAVMPKIDDLLYALALNPDVEIKNRNLKCNRAEYIKNLIDIINLMFLVNDNLARNFAAPNLSDGNIIHQAVFYSCPQILTYILEKITADYLKKNYIN